MLHHSTNSVGIVQSVNPFGNLVDVKPNEEKADTMIRIDSSAGSFMDFYSDFYNQLKNPAEYSFFKVRKYEAQETAIGVQEFIDCSSEL
ncbi:hypothetical protein [Chryseobacterium foetidum]|uniref:hypothetical protein n=1 Tax=Chryseobacterium foetidum TaxID=2951057 RepID=UPI0021C71BE4|nr:hypothetical protein [Chryseobacterium foetidum]